jgi:hypothetical protein
MPLLLGLVIEACGIAWNSWKTVVVGIVLGGFPLNLYLFLALMRAEQWSWVFLVPVLLLAIVVLVSKRQQQAAWDLWLVRVGLSVRSGHLP